MDECVQNSKLFQGIQGTRNVIHNGIDMDVFKPNESHHESALEAPDARVYKPKLIYMSTFLSNKIKGIELFIEAVHCLHKRNVKLDITTFGGPPIPDLPPIGTIQHMGRIDSADKLADLYSAADIMVTASRMESFGQTAAEALACGTPVVCFDTSGLRDIVQYKQNGYRAECFSSQSLADGITWCLADADRYRSLQSQARTSVVDKFDIDTIAQMNSDFYAEILASKI